MPVVVTTPGGTTTPPLTYTYVAAPAVSSIVPNAGPTAGGQHVTVKGSNFTGGQLTIGGISVTANCSATTCTFVTPAHAAGPVQVTVKTAGGSSSRGYTYIPSPSISGLNPNEGPTSGGTHVTIHGNNLGGASVTIGGIHVSANCSASACSFVTPPHVAGPVTVAATTPGGQASDIYTYVAPPFISSVDPAFGPVTGGTQVNVHGINLAGATVTIGGITVSATCSPTLCEFITPPRAAGLVQVVAATVGGSAQGPFTYLPLVHPTVISVSPSKGPSYGGTTVTITGTGFKTGSGLTKITFGGIAATAVSCSSSTRCRATTPIGLGTVPVKVTVSGLSSAPSHGSRFNFLAGYYLLSSSGLVYPFGFAINHGSVPPSQLKTPAVSIAFDPATHGYWVAERGGKVVGFDAPLFREMAGHAAPSAIVAVASTPDGHGYWLTSASGKVYPFGDAGYFGQFTKPLNKPVLGIFPTPDGQGYFLLAGDGGIFTFGDATFHGSTGSRHIPSPIVGMSVDRQTGGYWLTAANGAVYAFDAPFLGDMHTKHLKRPVLGVVSTPNGEGYYLVAQDGGVFAFGQATFFGSLGHGNLQNIVSMSFED